MRHVDSGHLNLALVVSEKMKEQEEEKNLLDRHDKDMG